MPLSSGGPGTGHDLDRAHDQLQLRPREQQLTVSAQLQGVFV
jgi:hypothetical protein